MTTPQWGMSAGPLLSEDLIEADLLNAAMPIPYNAGDGLLSFENTAPPSLGFLPRTGGGDAVSSIMSSFDGRPLGISGTSDFQAAPPATSAIMSTTGTTATTSRGMFAPTEGVRAGQEEFLSAPKQILRPEMGSGLSVSLVLRNGTPPASIAGAVSAYIHIKNTRDDLPIRRVKICFPPEVRCTGLPDIPVLEAGQEIRLPLEITLSTSNGKSCLLRYFLFLICHPPLMSCTPRRETVESGCSLRQGVVQRSSAAGGLGPASPPRHEERRLRSHPGQTGRLQRDQQNPLNPLAEPRVAER
jgi:hypothetical protein